MKTNYVLNSKEQVNYNGQTLYLRIKSMDVTNPVVLFLHGGPGTPDRSIIMKHQAPLAEFCTMVAWDQRCAGHAYDKKAIGKETLTWDVVLQDVYNVISYLKERFGKQKIYIVGHSYGSMLGAMTAQKFPDDIEAFIGIGQVVDLVQSEVISYQFTLDEAKKRKDAKAVKLLEELGAPVNGQYKDGNVFLQRKYLSKYGGGTYGSNQSHNMMILSLLPLFLKDYSIFDMLFKYLKGNLYSIKQPIMTEPLNFFDVIKELNVPVYLLLGHHDYICSSALGEKWFNGLKAPIKELVWFEKSAHSPHWEETELWNQTFLSKVLKIQ